MKQTLAKIRLFSLLPIKYLHILSRKQLKNRTAKDIFVVINILLSFALVGWWFFTTNSEKKYIILVLFIAIVIPFEIFGLIELWKIYHEFLLRITDSGNLKYNKMRDDLRIRCKDFTIGVDENAKVTIHHFIKKDKSYKEYIYIK